MRSRPKSRSSAGDVMEGGLRVVILGAGFDAHDAMRKLKNTPARVTLSDRNDYHAFQPLLYQVATDELARTEVAFPIRDMLRDRDDWVFHQSNITGVDLAAGT